MKRPKTPVIIYGLFNGDICEYVGATFSAYNRRVAHQKRGYLKDNPSWEFRIIIPRSFRDEEFQTILYYKSIGQARLNKNSGNRRALQPYSSAGSKAVRCSNGIEFVSIADTARFFKVCVATIRNTLRYYDGAIGRHRIELV